MLERMNSPPSTVKVTLGALLLMALAIVGQIAAGADYPTVPPGLIIPLAAAGLLAWRPRWWSASIATAVGLFIGVGAIATPDTGDHFSSGDGPLIASTAVELTALVVIVVAGALSVLRLSGRGTARG